MAGKRVKVSVLRAKVRVGQLPPNFLFEHAPGRELTLRKLAGRAVTLVFWNSSSRQSVEAVRDAEKARASGNGDCASLGNRYSVWSERASAPSP